MSPADSDLGSVISDRLSSPGRRPRSKLLRRDSSIGLQSVLSIAADEVHKCALHARRPLPVCPPACVRMGDGGARVCCQHKKTSAQMPFVIRHICSEQALSRSFISKRPRSTQTGSGRWQTRRPEQSAQLLWHERPWSNRRPASASGEASAPGTLWLAGQSNSLTGWLHARCDCRAQMFGTPYSLRPSVHELEGCNSGSSPHICSPHRNG